MVIYFYRYQLQRLLQLRPFCSDTQHRYILGDAFIEGEDWAQVSSTVQILQLFNKYSKKLQSTSTTLSDFYGYWIIIRIKLSQAQDSFSLNLLQEMNRYNDLLMENPVILSAIYLDPRYQRGIKEKKSLAIEFLASLYSKIDRVTTENLNQSNAVQEEIGNQEESDSYEDLNKYLDACITADSSTRAEIVVEEKERMKLLLEDFWNVRAPLNSSILDFWEKNKNSRPELYKLATVIFAVPPTQTTVERAFSTLALTLTSHRTKMSDDTLQNILLIRLNIGLEDNSDT